MDKKKHIVISNTLEKIMRDGGVYDKVFTCQECKALIGLSPATYDSIKDIKEEDRRYICYDCFIKQGVNGKFAEPTIWQMNEVRNQTGRTIRQQEVHEFYKEVRKELKRAKGEIKCR